PGLRALRLEAGQLRPMSLLGAGVGPPEIRELRAELIGVGPEPLGLGPEGIALFLDRPLAPVQRRPELLGLGRGVLPVDGQTVLLGTGGVELLIAPLE